MSPDLWALVTAVISAIGTVAAAVVAVAVYRGQLFEPARMLHQDLTTGAVAAARDRLGQLAHGRRSLTATEVDQAEVQQVVAAWFTLLWSFQRIEAGRRASADCY